MSKILINKDARKKILSGVNKLNDIVSLTIGPKGRNVIIDRGNGTPLITNDGVTITKNTILDDKYEQLGCDIIKQASLKTNDEVGDGTTSAVVLAAAVVNNAFREIEKGSDPNEIKNGLLAVAKKLINEIKRQSKPCKSRSDLVSAAVNSCANASDGELVARAFMRVGKNGLVTTDENPTGETKLTFSEGLNLEFDLMSPYFCDDIEKCQTIYTDAKILMRDGKINSIKEVLHILEWCVQNSVPLVLMADDFSGEIINALLLNRVKSGLRVAAIKYGIWAGGKAAILGDISAVTNATIIGEKNDLTLTTATPEHLGSCDKIIVGLTETTMFVGNKPQTLQDHILRIKTNLKTAKDDYTRTRLRERISKLENGIAVISVGCATAAETKERRLRTDDAVSAARAALQSGVVVGGGLSYYNLTRTIDKNSIGARILYKSLPSVIRAIYKNANINFQKAKRLLCGNFGYNAKNNEYCDLFAARIIDPAAVIQSVLRNAVSAAAILITTDGMITNCG
jgi:chaperonin GroEL